MKKNNVQVKNILNKINLGWNLGNFFDAHDKKFSWKDSNSRTLEETLPLWGNPTFNLECLSTLKKAGVNCLRIPITWSNYINIKNDDIGISSEFLTYLKTIIDEAIKLDFIVIIDVHHDDQTWLKIACLKEEFKHICLRFKNLWEAIAYQFKDYGNNLIFEGMNEIIDRSNPQKYDWVGYNKLFYKRLNILYKLFIKSVRKFSINNKNRTIMISTYGAQIHKIALDSFKMPKDKNMIVDLHFYAKEDSIDYLDKKFKYVKQYFLNKNIPIILGEMGSTKDCNYSIDVVKTLKMYATTLNIKCILWDNGSSRSFVDRESSKLITRL